MAQDVYKSKSFNKEEYSDEEILNKCGSIRFMSFESACALFAQHLQVSDMAVGYRVTGQGIEILY